jgi:hypothetical protein
MFLIVFVIFYEICLENMNFRREKPWNIFENQLKLYLVIVDFLIVQSSAFLRIKVELMANKNKVS